MNKEFVENRRRKLLERRMEIIKTIRMGIATEHDQIPQKDIDYQKKLVDKQIDIEKLIRKKLTVNEFDRIIGIIVRRNVRGWVGWEDFLGVEEHD